MVFGGFGGRFFPPKPSNFIKLIINYCWPLMVFGGFDGGFFPPKPSNLIKDFLEAEIVPPNLSTPIKGYKNSL